MMKINNSSFSFGPPSPPLSLSFISTRGEHPPHSYCDYNTYTHTHTLEVDRLQIADKGLKTSTCASLYRPHTEGIICMLMYTEVEVPPRLQHFNNNYILVHGGAPFFLRWLTKFKNSFCPPPLPVSPLPFPSASLPSLSPLPFSSPFPSPSPLLSSLSYLSFPPSTT